MFATAAALSVEDDVKRQLEALVRSGTTPQRVAQKCRVILLAQQGISNHSIAKQLGLSRPTVIAARARFGAGGVPALTAKPTRHRLRPTLTAELEKKILDTTLKTRPPDATQWTVRTLAKHLQLSRMMVHRVWQRFDIKPHRVEKFKLSNDPQFEEKVRDIAGLRWCCALTKKARFRLWTAPLRFCRCARDCRNARPTITYPTERPPYLPPSIILNGK